MQDLAPTAGVATMRVLIVDDEASVRLAIERRLRADSIATVQASNVKQAMDRVRSEPFDVVLCDLRMPGGDGTELVRWLSSYSPSTRIVVMSAYVTDEFRKTYGTSLEILDKPVDLDRLVGVLNDYGPRRGFYGNAIEVELFDYVQMIALSGRDKLIEVNTPYGEGRIWFEHGDIVHVEYGQYRGEMAFYKLLAAGRGTFKESFHFQPPKTTVLRSSTHLLMEAARRADEGTLGEPGAAPETASEVAADDETSFGDVSAELHAEATAEGEVAANVEPQGVPQARTRGDTEPVLTAKSAEDSERRPAPPRIEPSHHPSIASPPPFPGLDDAEDIFAPDASDTQRQTLGDEVSFDEEDLAVLDALTDAEEGATEEYDKPVEVAARTATADHAEEPVEEAPARESESEAAAVPTIAPEDSSTALSTGAGHAIFEDPEMRTVMLEQFWQFQGVNGVAIISSTGKVLAEDMRNNSSLVTLAGFYMRGAARIARTLGHNVFDGVVARSVNGQQMVMVSMGAASAVLSVEPGVDPEIVRDAVMGVE